MNPACVKREGVDDDAAVVPDRGSGAASADGAAASADSHGRRSSSSSSRSSSSRYFVLLPEQAEDVDYPPGCPVRWYDDYEDEDGPRGGVLTLARWSPPPPTPSSASDAPRTEGRRRMTTMTGTVRSVSIDFSSRELLYEVEGTAAAAADGDGGGKGRSETGVVVRSLPEHRLGFAPGCPVYARRLPAPTAAGDDDQGGERNGRGNEEEAGEGREEKEWVPATISEYDGGGQRDASAAAYSVWTRSDGVPRSRIKYRRAGGGASGAQAGRLPAGVAASDRREAPPPMGLGGSEFATPPPIVEEESSVSSGGGAGAMSERTGAKRRRTSECPSPDDLRAPSSEEDDRQITRKIALPRWLNAREARSYIMGRDENRYMTPLQSYSGCEIVMGGRAANFDDHAILITGTAADAKNAVRSIEDKLVAFVDVRSLGRLLYDLAGAVSPHDGDGPKTTAAPERSGDAGMKTENRRGAPPPPPPPPHRGTAGARRRGVVFQRSVGDLRTMVWMAVIDLPRDHLRCQECCGKLIGTGGRRIRTTQERSGPGCGITVHDHWDMMCGRPYVLVTGRTREEAERGAAAVEEQLGRVGGYRECEPSEGSA